MTNKEKAREIAEYYTDINDIGVALNSAKEMAEWKDQQFKKYLEKKFNDERNETGVVYGIRAYLLEEIINELFPKTENDDLENDE